MELERFAPLEWPRTENENRFVSIPSRPSIPVVRFPAITTGRGSVILLPTRTSIWNENVGIHITSEEWEELSCLDSATLLCQRPEQQKQEHQTCEQRDPTCTTHLGSYGLFCHSRSDLGKFGRHHHTTRTFRTSRCHLYPFLFFSLSMSPQQFAPVWSRKPRGETSLARQEVQGWASLPISHRVRGACRCKSFDHQLLTGEADSDEVQLLTVGGETEDDLSLPTIVQVGEFLVEWCTRTTAVPQTRPRALPRFSWYRCVFPRRTRSSAPMRLRFKRKVSRQCSPSTRKEASMLQSRERMHACRSEARRWLR